MSTSSLGVATSRGRLGAWLLYDVANTVFLACVLSIEFPLWLEEQSSNPDTLFAIANFVALALVLIAAPAIGARLDRTGDYRRNIVLATAVCCGLTALLGTLPLTGSLVLFVFAYLAFALGVVVYDSLLPIIAGRSNIARISGLGVGLGYLGAVLWIGIATFGNRAGWENETLFKLAGLTFLLLALPCLLTVPKHVPPADQPQEVRERSVYAPLRHLVSEAASGNPFGWFLIARVLYTAAANGLTLNLSIYAQREVGLSENETRAMLAFGLVFALVGGAGIGLLARRVVGIRLLIACLCIWAGALALTLGIAAGLPTGLFWVVAATAGMALAGTWAIDRALAFELANSTHLGTVSSVYSLSGRVGSAAGPLVWAMVVNPMGLSRPSAVAALLILVLISMAVVGARLTPSALAVDGTAVGSAAS